MSLRKAIMSLSDDRDTVNATRGIVDFLDHHKHESFDVGRVSRATGVSSHRTASVLTAMAQACVIDCDGDPASERCTYAPDGVLDLEVRRYLRSPARVDSGLQQRVERFRGRLGPLR